jgi:hypothetical protein
MLTVLTLVLDPRCKLEYFKMAKWEKEWIDEAERLTRQEYIDSYRDLEAEFAEPSIVLAAQAEKQVSISLVIIDNAKLSFRMPRHLPTCSMLFQHSQGCHHLPAVMNFLDTLPKMLFR